MVQVTPSSGNADGSGRADRTHTYIVTLRDKTKLKGYVREASDDGFVVVDGKTGATSQVLYPAVRKVKGHNYETGEVIGYVLFFGMIVAWTILQLRE